MNLLDISKVSYYYLKYMFYILLFITIFTTNTYAPTYLDELNIIIKLFICTFLIYKFNPLTRNDTFDDFDKTIVFDSALYLLSTGLIISIIDLLRKHVNILRETYINYKKMKSKKKMKSIKNKIKSK